MSNFREVTFSALPVASPRPFKAIRSVSNKSKLQQLSPGVIEGFLSCSVEKLHQPPTLERPLATLEESPSMGSSTVLGASFNFINSIVGAGIIGKIQIRVVCCVVDDSCY